MIRVNTIALKDKDKEKNIIKITCFNRNKNGHFAITCTEPAKANN